MGKPKEENSKKAAGNAKKAEVAAQKKAVEDKKKAAAEDADWAKGSKSNAKKEDAEAKKAEAAAKKAERDALLAEEEKNAPSKPKNTKTATKKNAAPAPSRGTLDLSQLDAPSNPSALNASGIDAALDALSLANNTTGTSKIEKHPEKRFKAAYAAFEERRMPEVEKEYPGLRRNQRQELIRKEFEKSEENPFNQVTMQYDASRAEEREKRDEEREKLEKRLGE